MFLLFENSAKHVGVKLDTLVDIHLQATKHDNNQARNISDLAEVIDMKSYPPVLVPPIRSNNSQGFTGFRPSSLRPVLVLSINHLSISNVESPRTPPPSRESKQRPASSREGPPRAFAEHCCIMITAVCHSTSQGPLLRMSPLRQLLARGIVERLLHASCAAFQG